MKTKPLYSDLFEMPVKTTPENVKEANRGLFNCKMTLPAAAKHCGMTQKEMKMTFREYLKYHPPTYGSVVESVDTPDLKSVGN